MRLLLIEDDSIMGSSLKKVLEKNAYGVDWIRDGETGLDALTDGDYVVAILDVNLPKLTGFDVLRRARQRKIAIPVLMLTALDSVCDRVNCLDDGADDYMTKPFDLDELLARIRALVRRYLGRSETVLRSGYVELDPPAMIVRCNGAQV